MRQNRSMNWTRLSRWPATHRIRCFSTPEISLAKLSSLKKEQLRFRQRFMLYFAVGLAVFAMAFAIGLTLRKNDADNVR